MDDLPLRESLSDFLKITIRTAPVTYQIIDSSHQSNYVRHLIEYRGSELELIRAYLFHLIIDWFSEEMC